MNTKQNTPKHCHGCDSLKGCRQAQFMTDDTVSVEGVVSFDACDHFCLDCHPEGSDTASLNGEYLDSPAHCADCGCPLDHELTAEGVEYVKEAIADTAGCCRELWPVIWADYLESEGE